MKKLLLLVALFLMTFSVPAQERVLRNARDYEGFEKFLKVAADKFLEISKKTDDEFKLGSYSRWDFRQDTGQIVFSDSGVNKLIADVQIAGTWASNQTWMWAWHNKSLDAALIRDAVKVREWGSGKKYSDLTTPVLPSDREYAWALTAAAGYLTKAKSAYRGENGTGYVYFLITDLKWVK